MSPFLHFVNETLSQIEYKSVFFALSPEFDDDPWLQVRWAGICSSTGVDEIVSGRKWRLSQHMTKSEIVRTAFKAILTAEEHEIREHFRYSGCQIFGPHFDVDLLARLCGQDGSYDKRMDQPMTSSERSS